MKMTPRQIFDVMRNAGFSVAHATTMTAIALRESGGDPAAFNGDTKTGDRSYGLLQINMFGSIGIIRMEELNLIDEKQLFNPAINARAGFQIWAGQNKNLDVAWYIARPGPNRDKYEQFLIVAQTAALEAAVEKVKT